MDPCPECDQASVVDEDGQCIHCGADRSTEPVRLAPVITVYATWGSHHVIHPEDVGLGTSDLDGIVWNDLSTWPEVLLDQVTSVAAELTDWDVTIKETPS